MAIRISIRVHWGAVSLSHPHSISSIPLYLLTVSRTMSTDPNIVSEIPGEREVEAWLQSLPKDWPALGPLKQATEANIVERTILLVDKMLVFLLFQPGAAGMLSVQPPPTVLRDVWFEGGQEEKRRKLRDDAATIYQNAPLSRFLLLCPGTSFLQSSNPTHMPARRLSRVHSFDPNF